MFLFEVANGRDQKTITSSAPKTVRNTGITPILHFFLHYGRTYLKRLQDLSTLGSRRREKGGKLPPEKEGAWGPTALGKSQ
jgi:hypothetical protein